MYRLSFPSIHKSCEHEGYMRRESLVQHIYIYYEKHKLSLKHHEASIKQPKGQGDKASAFSKGWLQKDLSDRNNTISIQIK